MVYFQRVSFFRRVYSLGSWLWYWTLHKLVSQTVCHITAWLTCSYPKSQFFGIDLSSEAIAQANKEKEQMGLNNSTFWCADLTDLPEEITKNLPQFNLVTSIMVLHDISFPKKVVVKHLILINH